MFRPKIKFVKIRDVKSPSIGTKFSGGIDFYIPKRTQEMIDFFSKQKGVYLDKSDMRTIYIDSHESILIPSGLKLNLPKNKSLFFCNKSGIASKKSLLRGACLVDSDYRDEIFFNLVNTSDSVQAVEFGQKIIQGLLIPNYFPKLKEYDKEEELYKGIQTRFGGFGSTGI